MTSYPSAESEPARDGGGVLEGTRLLRVNIPLIRCLGARRVLEWEPGLSGFFPARPGLRLVCFEGPCTGVSEYRREVKGGD